MVALPSPVSLAIHWTLSRKLGQTKSDCCTTSCPGGQQVLRGSISKDVSIDWLRRKNIWRLHLKQKTRDSSEVSLCLQPPAKMGRQAEANAGLLGLQPRPASWGKGHEARRSITGAAVEEEPETREILFTQLLLLLLPLWLLHT